MLVELNVAVAMSRWHIDMGVQKERDCILVCRRAIHPFFPTLAKGSKPDPEQDEK